jgi:hypothetical protein
MSSTVASLTEPGEADAGAHPAGPPLRQGGRPAARHAGTDVGGQPGIGTLLRLRWAWLASALAAGAVFGAWAAGSIGGADYRATTVLEIALTSDDSNRVAQLAQAAARLGESAAVMERAAAALGVSASDLRDRTQVSWEDGTDIVEVTVTAPSADAAVENTNAVAEAMRSVSAERAEERLQLLLSEGDRVLQDDVLSDAAAEEARKSGLGSAVAGRQDEALVSATLIDVLDPAEEAAQLGVPVPVGAALGGLGGLALAAAAAVTLPLTRRRVTGNDQLAMLAPALAGSSTHTVEEQAGRLLDGEAAGLVVLGMLGAEEAAGEVAARIARAVRLHEVGAELVDARAGLDARTLHALRRPAPAVLPGTPDAVHVVVCAADEQSLELVAGQSRLLTLVVTTPRTSTIQQLRDVAAAVRTTKPAFLVWE